MFSIAIGKETSVQQSLCRRRSFFEKIGLFAFVFFGAVSLYGAYLTNVPQTLRQPDGTILHCLASGDEFYNWLHDLAGFTIMQDSATGYYVYALKTASGHLVPSSFIAGRVDPALLGLEPGVKKSPRLIKAKLAAADARLSMAAPAPKTGTISNLVIFIRFSDESEFTNAISGYETNFNTGTGSMNAYFKEASYNVLTVNTYFYPNRTGATVVSYKDTQPRSYYKKYDATTNPNGYTDDNATDREHALLKNAVDSCSAQIVAAGLNLDGDGDKRVDNVCFIISGTAEGWSDLLWPHMWSLWTVQANIGTKRVYTYNFQLNGTSGPGPSVLCHEMGHSLGAPDFYRYTNKTITPIGYWDVMSWNLSTPQHMSAFTKWRYMTWISSIPKITSGGSYSLNPITSSSNNCYRIDSPNSTTEYFVVEFRKKQNFDSGMPGEGLVVYRVNSAVGVDGKGNSNGPPDELYVYRPGGTTTVDGTYNNAAFSSGAGRTAINDSTDPSSFLSDGSAGGLAISNIGAVGSTISFNVGFNFMRLSRTKLNFGAIAGGAAPSDQAAVNTGAQSVIVTPISSWTATPNNSWIGVTPTSGTGTAVLQISVNPAGLAAGTHTGTISVTDPSAANTPQMITVTLVVYNNGASASPFGEFATPVDGTTGITGAIPVTGWILDDVEVTQVEIKRDSHATDPSGAIGPDGLVFIGYGLFVAGARPDVEAAYPAYPFNYRAGWGYMLLTNFLPLQGNGSFRIHAFASDKDGHRVLLGSKTITCANASAVKPFGTLDTPAQGGDASGAAFPVFGWVLTPMPKTVAKDGSKIDVYVDSVKLGNLSTAPNVYNQYRVDVSTLFSGLNNTGGPGAGQGGPVGAFFLNTTTYTNAVHTIYWIATDDQGQADGIGSRYFNVVNAGSAPPVAAGQGERMDVGALAGRLLSFEPISARRGFDESSPAEALMPDFYGSLRTEVREVERLELDLGPGSSYRGYLVVGDELRPLPVGSTLDPGKGTFSWLPGPGFLGTYRLVFTKEDESGAAKRIPVTIMIRPKYGK